MKTCEVRRFLNHLFRVDSEADPLPDYGDFPPGDRIISFFHAAHQAVQHLVKQERDPFTDLRRFFRLNFDWYAIRL